MRRFIYITIAFSVLLSLVFAASANAAPAYAAGNLALNRPATASSVESGTTFVAANAVDGNTATRWASSDPATTAQWIYVDLGATNSINHVVLNWEAAYASSYQVQVSNDASAWTTIYATTTGNGGIDDLTGLSGSGRYVRVYSTVRGTTFGYSLWEFEVYGPSTATATNTPTRTPTQPASSNVYQAETASIGGGVTVDTNHAGFFGTGFLNFPLSGGSAQLNNVDGGAGGNATLRIRYALGATAARTGRLTVNGVGQNITFPLTANWDTWALMDVVVPLNGGATNTIRFDSNGQDLANLDQLEVIAGGIIITSTPTRTPTRTPTPTQPSTTGNFPARFAAPYVETWNNTSVNSLANATGHKFYTLAFIIAPNGGGCTATWNGDTALSTNLYVTDINNLRAQSGDVIISFGGASGKELGQACTSVSSLQAAYQSVITKYNLKWIDLDIESGAENDTTSVNRRNQAIAGLQAANPGLKVSYTLAVDRTGLPSGQINLLKNAKSNGVRVDIVNIMAMDYGPCYTDMGQAAIDAASATHNQLTSNGITAAVGVTPMIGVNDVTCENFTTSNAQQLVNYAQSNNYISLLAFWAVGADTSGHSYLNIFKTFH